MQSEISLQECRRKGVPTLKVEPLKASRAEVESPLSAGPQDVAGKCRNPKVGK